MITNLAIDLRPKMIWLVIVLSAVLTVGMLNGCALKSAEGPPSTTLTVKPDKLANDGKPFYLVIRAVDTRVFLTESYQDVAASIFQDPPSPSLLSAVSILPGNKTEISVVKPESIPLAIYCMFTEPGENWKMMIPPPLYSKYMITIKDNVILETEKVIHRRKGLFQRIFSKED